MDLAPYSVLISIYKNENPEYLNQSLQSVLNQTKPPNEIVIVKDGPLTEDLERVLVSFSRENQNLFKIISYENNRGLWYALSVGVPACKNELIMRMDVDDWMVSDRAEKQLSVFRDHPEYDCVGTLVTEFEGNIDNPIALVDLPEFQNEILAFGKMRCPFRHPTLMYKKSAVMKAGNYQEMPFFEDYDLYMRLASTGCIFYNIQESLVYMRTSPDFYARRGSLAYMHKMLHFKKTCLERGDYSTFEFLACTIPHMVVCLMPNRLRAFIYKYLLRSKPKACEFDYE